MRMSVSYSISCFVIIYFACIFRLCSAIEAQDSRSGQHLNLYRCPLSMEHATMAGNGAYAAVRCCGIELDGCHARDDTGACYSANVTYTQASDECAKHGQRLCSAGELLRVACCEADNCGTPERVWTRRPAPTAHARRLHNWRYHSDNKKVIIGIGSGRCGTLSVATLLDRQPGVSVSHEHNTCEGLEWNRPAVTLRQNARARLAQLKRRPQKVVGDIALWYLPYVDIMLHLHKNLQVVALKRKKEDTVKSFERWFGNLKHFPWVSDQERSKMFPTFVNNGIYDKCYPRYTFDSEHPTLREGASKYYDDYYDKVDQLIRKFPDRIKLFDTYAITNNATTQQDMFEFLGLESATPQVVIGMHPTDLDAAKANSAKAG